MTRSQKPSRITIYYHNEFLLESDTPRRQGQIHNASVSLWAEIVTAYLSKCPGCNWEPRHGKGSSGFFHLTSSYSVLRESFALFTGRVWTWNRIFFPHGGEAHARWMVQHPAVRFVLSRQDSPSLDPHQRFSWHLSLGVRFNLCPGCHTETSVVSHSDSWSWDSSVWQGPQESGCSDANISCYQRWQGGSIWGNSSRSEDASLGPKPKIAERMPFVANITGTSEYLMGPSLEWANRRNTLYVCPYHWVFSMPYK